jgi:hypothetical protein
LFCLSAVSSYRALTFFWYLHGSVFRDTRKGYLRVKGESKANSFYEVYFHLLDRQDKLLHMTPRTVMTPHWSHMYASIHVIYIKCLHFWNIFLNY